MSGCNFPNLLLLLIPSLPGFSFPSLSIALTLPPIELDFGLACPID